jgi:uncharacterized protein (TIGR03437 family)
MLIRFVCRSSMLMLLLAIPAFAQFSQLAVTDDGTQVYFTSQLLLRGAGQNQTPLGPEARLYRFGPDGVTLFAERGALASQHASGSDAGVSGPQVSGDGSVVSFTFTYVCLTDPQCISAVSEGEIRGSQTLDLGEGSVQLSRNGQWALLTKTVNNSTLGTPQPPTYVSTLINLATGERTDAPPPPPFLGPRTVSSDGTLLVRPSGQGWGLWKQGVYTQIPLPSGLALNSSSFILSDDASTLFTAGFSIGSTPSSSLPGIDLLSVDTASGNVTTFFHSRDSSQPPTLMAASSDGKTALFRINRQGALNGPAYLADVASGRITAIGLPDGEYVSDGTLTGTGDIAFLVTTAGRIVKATASTGGVESLFPAVPFCDTTSPVAAGSMSWITCSITGSATDLQGQILIGSAAAPVLATRPPSIAIQVPWEAQGLASLTLLTPNASPFQAAESITVLSFWPGFLSGDPAQSPFLGLDMIKGDWSGPVTSQPAPGDIVYLYMTGLGPVGSPLPTGTPASLTAPDPIVGTLTCRFLPQTKDATTLFAGLAPGTLGIYQVALQLPSDATAVKITGLSCTIRTPNGSASVYVNGL